MPVNWGLAAEPLNGLEALRYFGQAQQDQLRQQQANAILQDRQRKMMMEQRQEAARSQASQRLASGDMAGAQQLAIGSGDYDLSSAISKLGEAERKQASEQAGVMFQVANGLKSIPAEQRQAQLAALAPQLQARGFSPQELEWIDLTDQGLERYGWLGQTVKQQLDNELVRNRISDIETDNERANRLAQNTVSNSQARLALARQANARAAEARNEGRVRFRERDKDRAALAASGRFVPTNTDDLDY